MIDGYRAYKFYLATRLHFTTDKYDVFASKGAVTCSRDSFEKRNDKYMFMKLGQRFNTEREYIQFLASNFIYGNPNVIYSGSEADESYIEWQRRKQSITKLFSDDCDKLINANKTIDEIINCTNNQLPYIILLYIGKKINVETIRILDDGLDFVSKWEGTVQTMFADQIRVIKKAKGFIKYDKDRIRPVFNNLLEQTWNYKDGQHIQEAIASV
jgi:hypothetical protein